MFLPQNNPTIKRFGHFLLLLLLASEVLIMLAFSFISFFLALHPNYTISDDARVLHTLVGNKELVVDLTVKEGKLIYKGKKEAEYNPVTSDVTTSFDAFKQAKKEALEPQVTIAFVGDIMLSREVQRKIRRHNNIHYPFMEVTPLLANADLRVGNLETPIADGRAIGPTEMMFRTDPDIAEALKAAGFNVLVLANNHVPNFGENGVNETLKNLQTVDIQSVGAGQNDATAYNPEYVSINDFTFAFLAFNDTDVVPGSYGASLEHSGTALMDINSMAHTVKNIRDTADFVIVSMHSGTEYQYEPNARQKEFAHAAIDAGADLVYGHHPHILQPIEEYNGKYIMYSLGNFVFDQMWSPQTRESIIAQVTFSKDGVQKFEFTPLQIYDYSQPREVDTVTGDVIANKMALNLQDKTAVVWDETGKTYMLKTEKRIYDPENYNHNNTHYSTSDDLDEDGATEIYTLDEGIFTLYEDGETLFATPEDMWIDSFEIADATNDGTKNIVFSLWKVGSFGNSKPFWQEDDESIKNHLFVYEFQDNTLKPVWHSSNLSVPNCEFHFEDVDGDSLNELLVSEGSYEDFPACNSRYLAVWKWDNWGFFNEWRSE